MHFETERGFLQLSGSCEAKNERIERLEKSLEIAIENRQFEIDLLWKRATLFWGFIAALFIAVAALYKDNTNEGLVFVLCLVGIVFSLVWTLANRGSKSWQESWEIKADFFFEERYNYKQFYDRITDDFENDAWLKKVRGLITGKRPAKYSLSRLLIALSDVTVLFWVAASIFFANKICEWRIISIEDKKILVIILAAIFFLSILYIFISCRSGEEVARTKVDLKTAESIWKLQNKAEMEESQ